MSYSVPDSRRAAKSLDEHDILRHAREAFDIEEGVIYLVGHSLGPATHNALDALSQAGQSDWRTGLIRSWNEAGWFDLARETGLRLGRLIGAEAGEVIVADSVSTNLFKLASATLPLARAKVLIVEEDEFPTDQYIIEALSRVSATEFRRAAAGQGLDALAETGGVLVKSLVNYRSAEIEDMARAEQRATDAGGVIVWDLSHATGVVDVDVHQAGAKLATGCTYKYLNGGPGAPAFVYARADIASALQTPLPGWMGHARPFAFEPEYAPVDGIGRFANGTPPILSLAALSGAIEAFEGADMELVQAKARTLGDLVVKRAQAMGCEVVSPLDSTRRGGHVSFRHPDGYPIVQALIARNILADFRAPDTIRFGVSPLYLRFCDVWDAMDALEDILMTKSWDQPRFHAKAKVT
ncbi:kynureninase [Henriciella litoralis]|uniref:kynureninase n=1 Tax=Henriciella litoralis TaxID=568102 RepID=UPI000A008EF4|nr:aminotransferase class V-fold PLP-dependent enzyme [Henriciella litoralis]